MKKIIFFLIASCGFCSTYGQITIPVIKANFGVDADLRANYFNGAVNSAADDWYNNGTAGTGQFVIDTAGAAAIVAAYTSNPASRMFTFSRIMKQAPYSIVNNRLLIDAIFHRDFHGADSTVFASGSSKNGMSPVNWSCPVAQNVPDKNDILDAFVHVRRAGPNVTDSLWMFGGLSLDNITGNRYFDFELYQTDIYYDRPNQVFGGYGPDAGHTSWLFDAAGKVTRAGDIIFTAEYGSSSLTLLEARIWVNQTALSITPANFSWGGLFDGAGAGATFGYASILPKTAGAFYTGLQSVNGVWAGPFSLVLQNNAVVTTYTTNQFMEFSVNLTKLGIEPGSFSNNPCGNPYRRVLIKSRASTSFTSELKDFIAPFKMFDFAKVDAYTAFEYFCGTFPSTTIYVYNPNPNSTYTWSTPNGNIVGSNIGTSIVVNRPGTYYVNQQLHVQCPVFSTDSVKILFDSVCVVLNVDLLNFNARKEGTTAVLNWQASNNQEASNYSIEYSFDSRNFVQLATIPASNIKGLASYSFSYPLATTNASIIYYRIRVKGKTGVIKYSNIIALRTTDSIKENALLFPNPSHGELWFSFNAEKNEMAEVCIWNAQGNRIANTRLQIHSGKNLAEVAGLAGKPTGVYFVKIKLANDVITRKILIVK